MFYALLIAISGTKCRGFALIQAGLLTYGSRGVPVASGTVIGGYIFGLGIVLAEVDVPPGPWYRAGEGIDRQLDRAFHLYGDECGDAFHMPVV